MRWRNGFTAADRVRPFAAGLGITIWLVAIWLLMGSGPLREQVTQAVLRDGTQFTPGYSEAALDSVARATAS